MNRLQGKTAVITGGNSGVGEAAALLFAKEGANVVISARRASALDAVAEKIKAAGGSVLTYVTLKNGTEAVATSEGRLSDALKPGSTAYLYWNPAQAAVIGGTSHGA